MNDASVFIELVTEWAWIGWLVLIAVFLVIEMLTLDFTFLMLALGSAVGLIVGLIGVPLWAQLIIAAVAAALFILVIRPPLLRRLHRGEDPTKSNVDALIGLRGTALADITRVSGQVKVSNGDTWTARTETMMIPQGAPVVIASIDGATAIVRLSDD
ncbi:NfeD family protein [Microbacterium sp.]|uniref:NfeD family protein n=1 Tax=Microbacterium sp. TaxID=51671 RepID=UPI003F96A2A4